AVPPQLHTPELQTPALPALQLASPVHPQLPAVHPNPVGQALAQPPQLSGSEPTSTQPPALWQHTSDAEQPAPPSQLHASPLPPATHASPGRHSVPAQTQSPLLGEHVGLVP